MGHALTYTHFDETDEIRALRREWLIAKESYGAVSREALTALTGMLQAWLAHKGMPHDEQDARHWVNYYAKQVMVQQLNATGVTGSNDPDIVGSLGIDEVDQLIRDNQSLCTRCGQPVFWAYVVKRDGDTGKPAPFDLEPHANGEHHLTVRGSREGAILAAHRWGVHETQTRYLIHFDSCMQPA